MQTCVEFCVNRAVCFSGDRRKFVQLSCTTSRRANSHTWLGPIDIAWAEPVLLHVGNSLYFPSGFLLLALPVRAGDGLCRNITALRGSREEWASRDMRGEERSGEERRGKGEERRAHTKACLSW